MMISLRKTLLLGLFLLCIIICFDVGYSQMFCPQTVQYNLNSTSGAAYRNNVESLLSELSSKSSSPNGFYNFTAVTAGAATAYGLFYCWGEATTTQCQTCVETARLAILRSCPNTTWALTMGQDLCMLRYSNESIFSRLDENPETMWISYATKEVSNTTLFDQVLSDAFIQVTTDAANGDVSGKKYAFRESNYTSSFQNKVYSVGQCTPDLTNLDCKNCLTQAYQTLPQCCSGRAGGNVLYPSCRIRYEIYPFFQAPPPPPQQPTSTPGPANNQGVTENFATFKSGNGGISTTTIAAIVIPIVVIIVALVAIFFCKARRAKMRREPYSNVGKTSSVSNIVSTDRESLRYNFNQIQDFTDNFADENLIGRGGFGPVYKGLLPNGKVVAVKRLSRGSTQGGEQFLNEIVIVAKLQHRNLVRLLGYCLEGQERILIYEFVINRSLDYFLFDPEKQPLLDWFTRYKIIGGIARGLLYLHEDSRVNIIHRDLKPGNVLLDENMNSKIADFGMARLFEIDQTVGNTNTIAGTFGYMAPEYALHGLLSVKSDVFSFGVLVLEIISGKKISNTECFGGDDHLLTYAWKKWRDGKPLDVMDPAIGESYDRNEVIRCIHIGLLCVEDDVERRPTMASVILMFNSNSISLSTPNQPAFFVRSSIAREIPVYSDKSSSHPENSENGMSITEFYPR